MGIFSVRRGGSGTGVSLGPETNEFTGATETAAETARDTYTTANSDWLSAYDDNKNFYIELTYGTTVVFQRRSGDTWEDVSYIVQGEQGEQGERGPGISTVMRANVTSQASLNALSTDDRVAVAKVTTAFGSYQVNDVLIYDADASAWEILVDADDYEEGLDSVQRSEVSSQTALNNLTTDNRIALAKITTAFSTYQVNDILIYDSEDDDWELLVDADDYTTSIQGSEVASQTALDNLTTDNRVALAKITTAFSTYSVNDILIYDTESDSWEVLVTASDYTTSIQSSEVGTQSALNNLTTDNYVALAKITTAFSTYQVNDILIYDSESDSWEVLVDASDYSGSGSSSIERSEVASQTALNALTTDNRIAIAKITTAFGAYAVNDILIYDSEDDAWEVLVDASDYSGGGGGTGVSAVQRSEVSTQAELAALTTSDRVAIAIVTTAFGDYDLDDILIYDTESDSWEVLVDGPEYKNREVEVVDVDSQTDLDDIGTARRFVTARVTTAFGDWEIDDLLVYNTVSSAWEYLVDASQLVQDNETYPWAHSIEIAYDTTGSQGYSFEFIDDNNVKYLEISDLGDTAHDRLYYEALEMHDEFAIVTVADKDELYRGEIEELWDDENNADRIAVIGIPDDVSDLVDGTRYLLEFTRSIPDIGLTRTETEDVALDAVANWAAAQIRDTDFGELETYGEDISGNQFAIPFSVQFRNVPIPWAIEYNQAEYYVSASNAVDGSDLQFIVTTISNNRYIQILSTSSEDISDIENLKKDDFVGIFQGGVFKAFFVATADWDATNRRLRVTEHWNELSSSDDYNEGDDGDWFEFRHTRHYIETGNIQRSEVGSQTALDALSTDDHVAIAKITTAFGSYQVNDVLVYDSESDSWELLVDGSDYTTSIQGSEVGSQTALNALTTDNRVALAKITTAFGDYSVNDILIYDSVADAWELLVDASDYIEGVDSIERSEVDSQTALNNLTTDDRVAIAKITSAFGDYQVNDVLIYDTENTAWELLVDGSDYTTSVESSEVSSQTALDALTIDNRVSLAKVTIAFGDYQVNDILIYDSEDDSWEVLVDASDYSGGSSSIERSDVGSQDALNALTTDNRVAIAKVTTAFETYQVNDVLIYDSEDGSWELLVDADDYMEGIENVQRSEVTTQNQLNNLVTDDRVAIAKVTTAFTPYSVNDILIYNSVDSQWEVLVDASDYSGGSGTSSIERSEVASQTALNALTTDNRVAIAKITTAFTPYSVNDILIYDSEDDAWEVLVDASDYSGGGGTSSSVQRSEVASLTELNALTTDDYVALAKVTTAFETYQVNDILIYDSVASAWEVLVDASDYIEYVGIQRSEVATQTALNALETDNRVALAKITAAFGSYQVNDILIYDSVASVWEVLVTASDYQEGVDSIERSEVASQSDLNNIITDNRVALVKVTTAFSTYAVNDILIYDSVNTDWEVLLTASDYQEYVGIERSEVATQTALDALTTDNRVAIAKVTTAFSPYSVNDVLIYDTEASAWELLVDASDYQEGIDSIERSEVSTAGELTALTTDNRVAIAKVTTAFSTYSVNDILIYDTQNDTWEVLITAADYQEGLDSIEHSEVGSLTALNNLTTDNRVAIAKVTTAFSTYSVNDILIYDTESSSWEVLVNADDYEEGLDSVQRSEVSSQIALDALTTNNSVALAKVTTAFGDYSVNDILIYDSQEDAWEVLLDASDYELESTVTDHVVLFSDTTTRTAADATFVEITLSRAPATGRQFQVELYFDGIQTGSSATDDPPDRYNTVITMLVDADLFLARPIHSSTNDPTGSIAYKTSRDVQNISGSSGFNHSTVWVAKGNADGTTMRLGCSHWDSFDNFAIRIIEYVESARLVDGTDGIPLSIWWGDSQTERLPDSLPASNNLTNGVIALSGGTADKVRHGGVGITFYNLSGITGADVTPDVADTAFSFDDADDYHIKLHFYGNQSGEPDAFVALMKVVASGDDKPIVMKNTGWSEAGGSSTPSGTEIAATYETKLEYETVATADRFYIRFFGGSTNNEQKAVGYIQFEGIN